jgi:hypothetical protein
VNPEVVLELLAACGVPTDVAEALRTSGGGKQVLVFAHGEYTSPELSDEAVRALARLLGRGRDSADDQ